MFHGWTLRTSLLTLGLAALMAQHAAAGQAIMSRPRGGTLQLRPEANVVVGDVKLKQLCRWSDEDDAAFAPVADLVVARLDGARPFVSVRLDEIRTLLEGVGMNAATVRFTGAAACTVSRTDVAVDNATAFNAWAAASEKSKAASRPAADSVSEPAAPRSVPARPSATAPVFAARALSDSPDAVRTLRDQLVTELAARLQLPVESMQISFDPRDEKVLSLTNPPFKFQVIPRKVRNLGDVNWDVIVVTAAGEQKANIAAVARSWQDQVVAARPIASRQILRDEDLEERRVLIDTLPSESPLTRAKIVGQQASMELKIGAVVTANSVDSVPLVRTGQLVTVTAYHGAVSIKTAARAIESATYGQPVKLRGEATRDVFEAIVTGQQEAMVGAPGVGG